MGGANLPSARIISNKLFNQTADSVVDNNFRLTEFVTFFGQFLDHSITLTSNDLKNKASVENIPVPSDDKRCQFSYIEFNRNVKANAKGIQNGQGPIRAINVVSSAVDLFGVYGQNKLSQELRTYFGGRLRNSADNRNLLPRNDGNINNFDNKMNSPKSGKRDRGQFFIAGDSRSNENPQLTALHTLFMRMHNEIANDLAVKFNTQSDEWLYQSARRVCQAYFQSVVYNEYLPVMTGSKLPDCPTTADGPQCFDQEVQIGISDIFSIAAFRVGHTMVGNFVHRRDANGADMPKLKLEEVFFSRASLLERDGIEVYIRGAIWNQAQKVDRFIVDALRNFLFEFVKGESGFDLAAINIQRGRDSNLPSFAEVKQRFLGVTVTTFEQITSDTTTIELLRGVYSDARSVELWVGLLCEDPAGNAPMGPTLVAIWRNEFERLRRGDVYFYQNKNRYDERLITYQPLLDVIDGRGLKMRDLITKYSGISDSELPADIWHMQ